MKRFIRYAAVPLFLWGLAAHAGLFSIEAEAQYWNPDASFSNSLNVSAQDMDFSVWRRDTESRLHVGGLSVSFQHFLPLLPNIRLETQDIDFTGSLSGSIDSRLDLSHDTTTLFYAPLDNDITRLHFGLSVKRVKGFLAQNPSDSAAILDELSVTIPMGYLFVETSLPFTGLSVQGRGHFFSFRDNEVQDIEASIRYRFLDHWLFEGYVSAGYRSINIKIDEGQALQADYDFRGPFIALNFRF